MIRSENGIRFKIIFPLVIMIACFMALITYGVLYIQGIYLNKEIEKNAEGIQKLFDHLLEEEAKILIAQLDFISNDPELIQAWDSKNRDQLYSMAAPIFQRINTFNVTHFYFVQRDQTCFLRVHAPEEYGDVINRYTMKKAVSTSQIAYGIELGIFGTFTLRVVYPWVQNDKLLGYLELGEEIDHLTPKLRDISATDLILTINKSNLLKENWQTGIRFLGYNDNWETFDKFVVIDKTVAHFSADIKNIVRQSHVDSQNIVDQDRRLHITATPLIDASEMVVGNIFSIYDFTNQSRKANNALTVIVLVELIFSIILFIFYYIYAGRIDRQIQAYANNLEHLVERRTSELKQAFERIKVLSGLLPICSSCKKIRDDRGHWKQIEHYIAEHSEANFTHGICPICLKKHYAEFYEDLDELGPDNEPEESSDQ